MPTFATTPRFRRDLTALAPEQRARFEKVVREEFVPDLDANQWRPGCGSSGYRACRRCLR